MEIQNLWPLAFVVVLIVPVFFWLRVRAMNRRKGMVTARCKRCGTDVYLKQVENFKCQECGSVNLFVDGDGKPLSLVRTYTCEACGEENFVGIVTCTACGKANREGVPA